MPIDYQHGKIYRIFCDELDEVYVGSTTRSLCTRFAEHRHDYRKIQEGKRLKRKSTVCKVLAYPSAKIELIEHYPCSSREELNAREAQVIRRLKCVNRQDPVTGKMLDLNMRFEERLEVVEKVLQKILVYINNGERQVNAGGDASLRSHEEGSKEVLREEDGRQGATQTEGSAV